jgi:ubiquinone/menaquinone biosynthesis C-methylase UbiE
MTDHTEEMIRNLELVVPLRDTLLPQMIEALQPGPGIRILDIGCGIGLQAVQFAEATQSGSHVTGLDISHDMLAYAAQRISPLAAARQVSLATGDMRMLPFADDVFDLCWSMDCLGYPAADPLLLLKEVARVAQRGANVAVLSWSSQVLLPGYAMLEARLNATASAYSSYLDNAPPEMHFMRIGGAFPAAGLVDVRFKTFVGEVMAPLDEAKRSALLALFEMLWGSTLSGASNADQREYKRLCRPDSPEFILQLPDYCAFFTYTMFSGVVQK